MESEQSSLERAHERAKRLTAEREEIELKRVAKSNQRQATVLRLSPDEREDLGYSVGPEGVHDLMEKRRKYAKAMAALYRHANDTPVVVPVAEEAVNVSDSVEQPTSDRLFEVDDAAHTDSTQEGVGPDATTGGVLGVDRRSPEQNALTSEHLTAAAKHLQEVRNVLHNPPIRLN